MSKPKKILTLFFAKGGFGEVILQTPFYRAQKRIHPDCIITSVMNKSLSTVLTNNPNVDNIVTYKSIYGLIITLISLKIKHFDYCYIFDKSWKSIYLARIFINADKYIGFHRPACIPLPLTKSIRYQGIKHESEYYLDLLDTECKNIPDFPEMFYSKTDSHYCDSLILHTNKPLVALLAGGANNPGVGDEPFRRWPLEKYKQLAKALVKKGYRILLVGGKNDIHICHEIEAVCKDNCHNYTGKLSLVQSGLILKKASIVVCHDSGLMHLASCFNSRLVCLFGPTSPLTLLPKVVNAQSIWRDEDIYTPDVRIHGTRTLLDVHKSQFFKRINTDDVLSKIVELVDINQFPNLEQTKQL